MRRVHTHNVDAREEEFADKVNIATAVTDRSNNLCLFHNYNYKCVFTFDYAKL